MPFTPTHVLTILPFAAVRRLSLPFSALAIGSMIPDLPLFLPSSPDYGTMHSIPGLFTAGLPLGLAWYWIFQLAMKRPLFNLLPEAIRRRTAPLAAADVGWSAGALFTLILALLIGSSTHLLWDSFTHEGRWGTSLLPGLHDTALTIRSRAIPGYKLLQYGSTLVGLPCLAVLSAIWLARRPESPDTKPVLPGHAKVAACVLAMAVPVGVTALVWLSDDGPRYNRLGGSITGSGLALTVATLAYGLGSRAIGRRPRAD